MKKLNLTLTFALIASLAILASCASSRNGNGFKKGKTNGTYSSADIDANSIEQLIQQSDLDEDTASELASNGNDKRRGHHVKIPRVINESVKKWIKYFTVDNPEWYQRALTRSEVFETNMKNILISYDVPEDLFYLALIESAFVQRAHSGAGAKGIWQFMKGTGRLYGLKVSRRNDERLDPYKATAAAAAYLRDLYNIYGSWYLAIASYNAGEGRIRNAILKHRERNFWELAAKNALPEETMNYVPKYIAAVIVAENPKKYGFNYNGPSKGAVVVAEDIYKLTNTDQQYGRGVRIASNTTSKEPRSTSSERVETTIYKVKKGDNLSRIASRNDVTIAQIRECNSRLKGDNVIIGQKLVINCSKTATITTVASAEQTAQEVAAKRIVYKVKYGDTLEALSKKFSVTMTQIKDCNPTVKRYEILAGQRLKINCTPGVTAAINKSSFVTHVVRRGESLWSISQKYDVTISDLMKWNNLKKRNKIFAGRKLKIAGQQVKKKELNA